MFDVTIPVRSDIDCYQAHKKVCKLMLRVGLAHEKVLFGINPLDPEELVIRSQHPEVQKLGRAEPMLAGKEGECYHFTVRAAAVRRYLQNRNYEIDDKKQWIRDRIELLGVSLIELVYKPAYVWCAKDWGFYIPEVIALGKLKVENAEKLHNAMTTGSGISRDRAFGFGLLQLLPQKGT
jgi:hypothetical protein